MKRISLISINVITAIPLMRFITNQLKNDFDEIRFFESSIENLNNYYSSDNKIKHVIYSRFRNNQQFTKQTLITKLNKYLRVASEIISQTLDRSTNNFYIIDYQVLALLIVAFRIFRKKKNIIYHQFELVDIDLLNGLNRYFFNIVLKHSDKLTLAIFPEENRRNYFIGLCSFPMEKTFILYNTCELAIQIPAEKHNLLNQIPANRKIIGHIGNVGFQHYLNELLDIIDDPKLPDDIHFLFLGIIDEQIVKAFDQRKARVTYFPAIPHNELKNVYPYLHYGLILYKAVDLNFEYCAPNKLFEYWSNGIPVLAHDLKGLHNLFLHPSMGTLTDMGDPIRFLEDFSEIVRKPAARFEILEQFKSHFEIGHCLESYNERLKPIFN